MAVEAVTSKSPIDNRRYAELTELFAGATTGMVYVTAFLSRAAMVPFLREVAWHTEVWIANEPAHLIHFNGDRCFGPHESN